MAIYRVTFRSHFAGWDEAIFDDGDPVRFVSLAAAEKARLETIEELDGDPEEVRVELERRWGWLIVPPRPVAR